MAVSFATLLYVHCFDMFARPVTSGPFAGMRAIFNSGPLTITNDEGVVIAEISDQETIVDFLMPELADNGFALPKQGDIIGFAADTDIPGGEYEITDGPSFNSGGQATYYIRRLEPSAP